MIVRVFLCLVIWCVFCLGFQINLKISMIKIYWISILILYKSNFGIFLSAYLAVFWLASNEGESIIPIVKIMQYALIFTFYRFTKRNEFVFFKNLSVSVNLLFMALFSLDIILSFIFLGLQHSS